MREDFYNFMKNYIEKKYNIKEIKNDYEISDIIGEEIDNAVDMLINQTRRQLLEEYIKD